MAAAVIGTAVVGEAVVGGDQRSSVGSSPGRWLLRIMPLLFRTMRRPIHRHRSMGHGGGVTPRSLTTPTRRLAPAGSEPFSPGEPRPRLALTTFQDVHVLPPCASRPVGTPSAQSSSSVSVWLSMEAWCGFPGACSQKFPSRALPPERCLEAHHFHRTRPEMLLVDSQAVVAGRFSERT